MRPAGRDPRSGLWPRGVPRLLASWYIGVSVSKFDQLVADGRMPKPVRIDGCVVYDIADLDAAFETFKAMAQAPAEKNPWDALHEPNHA
jgi:predicted DNA-binding transcriptional regulator AlpA